MSWKFLKKKKVLVTHSGSFHADDVFAAATLTLWLDQQGERYTIVRSRDPKIIAAADYVFDVGGEYDHTRGRYDHHQPEGAGKSTKGIPYAGFGLVWKHYGLDVGGGDQEVWEAINQSLVAPIDASDNGLDLYTLNELQTQPIRLQEILRYLPEAYGKDKDTAFRNLVGWARRFLEVRIEKESERVATKNELLQEALPQQGQKVVVLDGNYGRGVIWDTLVPHESFANVMYAVYSHDDYRHDGWNIVCLLQELHQKGSRLPFPQPWCGKEKEELERLSGVEDMKYCHRTGFLAGAKTKEAAIAFAHRALEVNGQ